MKTLLQVVREEIADLERRDFMGYQSRAKRIILRGIADVHRGTLTPEDVDNGIDEMIRALIKLKIEELPPKFLDAVCCAEVQA